ncbi:DUF6049 family protein [Nocardioides flavescens]|uniref:Uncharacterized protein n=1 Tax=Nocardioides flavescens TaxID=2691959 RepID=A0A6L7EX56_9ACTN|nr:DUF6049 family protein [Nocardioides flavescens]MXG91370.1 hypothetical protein [Nocardioides flavescens]
MPRRSRLSAALAALALPVLLTTGLAPAAQAAEGPGPAAVEGQQPRARTTGPAARRPQVSRHAARQAAVRARARAEQMPLTVTLDDLSPAVIPARGPITVTGEITNDDTVARTTINVYSFISSTPLTTEAELEEAAATDPSLDVGQRITEESAKDTIAVLEPGESQRFSLTVTRGQLGVSEPGVYWFGIHALSDDPEGGRDELADGKARTFVPLVPSGATGQVETSVVVPLRRQVSYAEDGSLDDVAEWTRALSDGGRLHSLVSFGAASGDAPVTWVVDPALVDAVRRLAEGNPPRSLAANLEPGQDGSGGEDAGTPTAEPGDDTGDGAAGRTAASESPAPSDVVPTDDNDSPLDLDELDPVVQAATRAAQAWLNQLAAAMTSDDEVLTLPYGDVDVPAAAALDPALLERAWARAAAGLSGFDVPTAPVVSSPSGFLSAAGLAVTPPGTVVIVSDAMFEAGQRDLEEGVQPPQDPAPAAAVVEGHRLLVASSGAADGGPGPGDRTGVTAMRQRLLAEAALRFLDTDRPPLTVVLPHDWNPTSASAYFRGLRSDAPWLDLTTASAASSVAQATSVDPSELRYPAWQAESELDAPSFIAATDLIRAGAALQSTLTLNNVVGGTVADQALGTTSYSARTRPLSNRSSAARSEEWIDARLAEVQVSSPQAVTLSSSSGRFNATIANFLDQPVTVTLQAQSDAELAISGPRSVQVPARGRTTVPLTATTDENGVHRVRLAVVDQRGVALGSATVLSVRSAQVSKIIWLFMAVGSVLLFGTIGVRLFRRIRAARRTPPAGSGEPAGSPAREPEGAGQR